MTNFTSSQTLPLLHSHTHKTNIHPPSILPTPPPPKIHPTMEIRAPSSSPPSSSPQALGDFDAVFQVLFNFRDGTNEGPQPIPSSEETTDTSTKDSTTTKKRRRKKRSNTISTSTPSLSTSDTKPLLPPLSSPLSPTHNYHNRGVIDNPAALPPKPNLGDLNPVWSFLSNIRHGGVKNKVTVPVPGAAANVNAKRKPLTDVFAEMGIPVSFSNNNSNNNTKPNNLEQKIHIESSDENVDDDDYDDDNDDISYLTHTKPKRSRTWSTSSAPPSLSTSTSTSIPSETVPIPRPIPSSDTHVFIDHSNIYIGFQEWKRDLYSRRKRQNISYRHSWSIEIDYSKLFSLIATGTILLPSTTRKSKAVRGILVGSEREDVNEEPEFLEAIIEQRWEAHVLKRVATVVESVENDGSNGLQTKPNNRSRSPRRTYEQCVDELLHSKISESLLDYSPSHLVIATGDGNVAEFGGGFVDCVRRALKRNWKVSIWSWEKNLSSQFRQLFGHDVNFRIIVLEPFVNFFVKVFKKSAGVKTAATLDEFLAEVEGEKVKDRRYLQAYHEVMFGKAQDLENGIRGHYDLGMGMESMPQQTKSRTQSPQQKRKSKQTQSQSQPQKKLNVQIIKHDPRPIKSEPETETETEDEPQPQPEPELQEQTEQPEPEPEVEKKTPRLFQILKRDPQPNDHPQPLTEPEPTPQFQLLQYSQPLKRYNFKTKTKMKTRVLDQPQPADDFIDSLVSALSSLSLSESSNSSSSYPLSSSSSSSSTTPPSFSSSSSLSTPSLSSSRQEIEISEIISTHNQNSSSINILRNQSSSSFSSSSSSSSSLLLLDPAIVTFSLPFQHN